MFVMGAFEGFPEPESEQIMGKAMENPGPPIFQNGYRCTDYVHLRCRTSRYEADVPTSSTVQALASPLEFTARPSQACNRPASAVG